MRLGQSMKRVQTQQKTAAFNLLTHSDTEDVHYNGAEETTGSTRRHRAKMQTLQINPELTFWHFSVNLVQLHNARVKIQVAHIQMS